MILRERRAAKRAAPNLMSAAGTSEFRGQNRNSQFLLNPIVDNIIPQRLGANARGALRGRIDMDAPPDPRDEEIARLQRRVSELAAANDTLEQKIAEGGSRSLIDGIPGLIAILAPDGGVETVNRQILEYCGCPLEELKRWASNGIVHEEDLPHVADVFGRSIATGAPYAIEQRLRRFDGEYRWFLNSGAPVLDASGDVAFWYVLLTDVDDLKRAEQALKERERGLRSIIDGIPGFIAIASPQGELLVANPQMTEYFGATVEELKPWGEYVHQADLPHVLEKFGASIASGALFDVEHRLLRADGAYRWFSSRGLPIRDGAGSVANWCFLLTDIDDRKRAEDALSARERDLRLIVDSIPGLVTVFTADGQVEHVNRPALEYFGKTLDELKQWQLSDAVHPDDRADVLERFTRAIASGAPFMWENRAKRADGVYRWLQTNGFPLTDENGHVVRWYNLLIDIDERKRAEEAVAASKQDLKLIIDTIPALAWSALPDGSAEFLNRHYLDYVGLSAEQALGAGWSAAVHPDDLDDLLAFWVSLLASANAAETEARLRRFDGVYRWFLFRMTPLRDDRGNIVKWYGVNTDIQDRKQAEAELRQASYHLNAAQQLSKTGSYTADLVRDEHTWSDEFYRICEFDRDGPVTISRLQEIVHPEDVPAYLSAISRALEGVEPDFEFRIVTASGILKHLRGLARREQLLDRSLFVGAVQDVTDRKVAEEARDQARSELERASRAMSLGVLAASIAHEVNQPLSGVITNANTLLRMLSADPPNTDGARKTARRAIRDGERAAEVVARLRALFGKKELAAEALDLNGVTREIIGLSSRELQRRRIAVHAQYDETLPRVTGDRVQLQQVILNFLLNASDAMQEVDDRPREIFISTGRDNGDAVRLTVRDTGVGVPVDSLNKLFDAFYTTKPDGMGIGLSVSRSIIERHRGRLWASTNDGPGAAFSFSIPCSPTLDERDGGGAT